MTTNDTDGAGTVPPLRIGLFDIMQRDPIVGDEPPVMYAKRLDDLAFADELALSIAFVAERHFMPTHACPSATTWIAAAAQRAHRMRLGVLAYTLPIRAPVQLAEEIAMLDLLTGGRLEIGLGLGHRAEELIALGVDPAQRVPHFQERLALMRALWTGGQVSFERGDIRVRDLAIAPLPVQSPHPPLWFAGTDPAAAQWMGSQGMGIACGFKPLAQLQQTVSAFVAGRDARTPETRDNEPPQRSGTIALMRSVVVGETDAIVQDQIEDDLMRIAERIGKDPGEGSRNDRRTEARRQIAMMRENEVMFAGGPETVAREVMTAREQVPFDLLLANVYAMGASRERIRTTMSLLAGPVRERIGADASGVFVARFSQPLRKPLASAL